MKRITAWLLAVVLCLNFCPFEHVQNKNIETDSEYMTAANESRSYAYGADYAVYPQTMDTYINPLYQDIISEEDLAHPDVYADGVSLLADDKPIEYLESLEAAGEYVREAMKTRTKNVVVNFKIADDVYADDNMSRVLFAEAIKHTRVPDEGDYLFFQYDGWRAYYYEYVRKKVKYVTIEYTFTYFTTEEDEAAVDTAIEEVLKEIDVNPTDGEPLKIRKIYDFVTSHVVYDKEHDKDYLYRYTAYAALVQGTAVCQGIASLIYRLCLEVGIDCRIIEGTGVSNPHTWNIVRVGDSYYNLDGTWDLGESTYEYFLKSEDEFEDHIRASSDGHSAKFGIDYSSEAFYLQYPLYTSSYTGDFTEHSHYYDVGTLFSEATCTEKGSVVYRCIGEDCDDYYFGVINAKGHSWNEGEIIKEASCSETGETSYICLVCGETKTDIIPTLEHSEVVIAGYEATCTDSGLSDSSYCSVCDEILEEQTEIAPLGHNIKEVVIPATLTKDGSYHYVCSVCDQALMTTASGTSISHPASFTLSKTSYTYDGKVKNPTLIIKDSKGKVISSDYYKIQKTSGRKKVGTYIYKITFKGLYSGSKTISFKINPKGTSIASISKKSKGFTVKWKKQSTQTTGYQIRYSTSSKMTNTKTVTISKNTTVSKTVSKLKSKKRYYVQVRTYKTVSGKKYYSVWSTVKYVVTK